MAKRKPDKPKKKRAQPWLAAARRKLRAAADERHEEEMTAAFLDLAGPVMEGLRPDADDDALTGALRIVKIAWNLPLVHAAPTDPDSPEANTRAEVEDWLDLPSAVRAPFIHLARARMDLHADCAVRIADVFARRAGRTNEIGLIFEGEEVGELSVLDVDEHGYPMASHSLIELSRPARDLLAIRYGDADAQRVVDLAVTAWNLASLDWVPGLAPDLLRRSTQEATEKALSLPPDWQSAFVAMTEARATRFSYDKRLVLSATATTREGMIYVQAASLRSERKV